MFSFVYPCGLKLRHRVTSQKDGLGHPFMVSQGMITDTELEHRNDSFT
ncbi:hypothetical protein YpAngola_A1977 [Yersinia pestis Angola]|nr:hypothetical protein YpAngola_A1977 [Yersinia pestis Angola]